MASLAPATALANDLHQAGPIASDDAGYRGSQGDCADAGLAAGEVLWHFVQTQVDESITSGSLAAEFETAGTVTVDSYKSAGGTLHFQIVTGPDVLLDATSTVMSGGHLNLSHICAAATEEQPTPTPTAMPTPTPTAMPTPTPTAMPTPTPTPTAVPTGQVMVMKHVCPDTIQSEADFDALGGFLAKVLACPVITLPGDVGPAGALDADDDFFDQFVANGEAQFNFMVAAGNGTSDFDDATFMPAKVCESDLNADANGDGIISADVCVEISHYAFDGVARGDVSITESSSPGGFRFGSIEFTPGSGDETTLVDVDASAGRIRLDTTGDGDVMVHVYNFANVEAQPTPTPSGTVEAVIGTPAVTPPATDTLAEAPTLANDGWRVLLLAFGALIAFLMLVTPDVSKARKRR